MLFPPTDVHLCINESFVSISNIYQMAGVHSDEAWLFLVPLSDLDFPPHMYMTYI